MKNNDLFDRGETVSSAENQVKIKQGLTKELRENLKDQGFEYIGAVEQEDTYYVEEGDKLEDKNLRVRKSGDETMITVKRTKESGPVLVRDKVSYGPIESEGEVVEKKDEYSTHQEVAVVRKKRKIFKLSEEENHPDVQVNVDEVKGLGQFIEIKVDKNLQSPEKVLNSVIDDLNLKQKDIEKKTYAQLSFYSSPPPAHNLTKNLMRIFDEIGLKIQKVSHGITKITVTTLAFIIGIGFSLHSREVILASILIISLSHAIADTIGIYTEKKLEYFTSGEGNMRLFLYNFFTIAGIPLLFVVPFLLLSISSAILVSVALAFGLLFFMSILIAAVGEESYSKSITFHIALFIGVSLLSYGIAEFLELIFAPSTGL